MGVELLFKVVQSRDEFDEVLLAEEEDDRAFLARFQSR